MNTDFGNITPCGGDCTGCTHLAEKSCEGCLKNGGKCVKMWENRCEIFCCCQKHSARFCGLCSEFPCTYLEKKVSSWDKKGISRLKELAEEYHRQQADFTENLPRLWNLMGSHSVMVLSTCADNRVTSRPMSTVIIDGKFYCQTDINYLKCIQLSENPGAALSFKNFSIEGICRNMGKPTEHDFFMNAMKEHFTSAAERWSSIPTECLLEITPTLVYLWDYENSKPYMEYWDFENKTYRKEWK